MSTKKLSTISGTIDAESRSDPFRHSLQPIPATHLSGQQVRRHRSMNNIKKPTVPDIPEVEKSDDDSMADPNADLGKAVVNGTDAPVGNVRISFTKKTRRTSNISRTSKASMASLNNGERGFVNYGYDPSVRSSIHGSMSSLPVIREQYCCCQRWTKMERNLATVVAVLALIIIILVIAISIVAAPHSSEVSNANKFGLLSL